VDLRVIPGLYDHRLTEAGRETLFSATWRLTPVADRTGMRFEGATLDWRERVPPFGAGSDPSNIVDAGYPVGSIQVPNGTQPIILHRDAVSGGGYAVVATVIRADLDRVAQCMPGTNTRFVEVDMDAALAARRAGHRSVAQLTNCVVFGGHAW
jgi:allophanate hydrolase subunit 2